LAELIMASEIFKNAMTQVEPHLGAQELESAGEVVFATIKGDVHDLGKNIVVSMLRCNGFTVHDLGVDVDPETIIDKLVETRAPVLGLSALLTTTFKSMKRTIEMIESGGLRQQVKVMVGGGPVDDRVVQYTGADALGKDSRQAVLLARQFVEAVS
jgi:5-methyltetrahydrofolate--homocysteine methyltransferase